MSRSNLPHRTPPKPRWTRVFLALTGLGASLALTAPADAAGCNNAPITTADSVATLDTAAVLIDPLANDREPDGQPLSLILGSNTCLGTVTLVGDLVRFTPMASHAETCSISYVARDSTDRSTAGTIAVTVDLFSTVIFADGFERGNTNAWSETQP